jgi:hypothetical protein
VMTTLSKSQPVPVETPTADLANSHWHRDED